MIAGSQQSGTFQVTFVRIKNATMINFCQRHTPNMFVFLCDNLINVKKKKKKANRNSPE